MRIGESAFKDPQELGISAYFYNFHGKLP